MKLCAQSMCFHVSLLLFCSPSLRALRAEKTSRIRKGVKTQGDIIIGGLIPVHFSPNFAPHPGNSSCKGSFHLRGYIGVEAMLYDVERINDNPYLLPGLKLGVDIKDTCGSVNYAIMESLDFNFIRNKLASLEQNECNENFRNVQAGATFAFSGDGESFGNSTSGHTSNSKEPKQQNLSGGKIYL
ncbi:PREDICTED: metabotropic glutamate receptor-like [Acropora digitifera]|uniref:metabotropic glutamate receptor-like n=1 Tax=Acropora digitifera TaxID=70779 RepID=UPI00077A7DB5|nr:PREDICTED: metabotropic glutamate receptor-like [Acropora digitifera]